MGRVPDNIFSCIFAYDGPTKHTFKKNTLQNYAGRPNADRCADIICVLDEYVAVKMPTDNGEKLSFLETQEDSLMAFFVNLSEAVYKNYWQGNPNLGQYMNRNQAPQF